MGVYWRGWNKFKNLEIIPGGTFVGNPGSGATYFVNKATGHDSNDGLSWGSAFKELNAALIASEAKRLLLWGTPSTGATTYDHNARNRIFVQGVNADYEDVSYTTNTTEPYFTEIYGVSGYQRATLMGQVVIGHHNGTERSIYMYAPLGTDFNNIQFEGGTGSLYTARVANAIGCTWVDCAFVGYTNGVGCFETTGTFCGNLIKGCTFEMAGGTATNLMLNSGSNSSDNTIEDCNFIHTGATSADIRWKGWGIGDKIKRCDFFGTGTVTVGIVDTSDCGVFVSQCNFSSNHTDVYTGSVTTGQGYNFHAGAAETND